VSTVQVTSGPAAVTALLAGDADVMVNSPDFVLQANDKGQSIKYVVGNTDRNIVTLMVGNKWPTPNKGKYPDVIRDLKGAKIGVTARASAVENFLRAMLKDAGLDPDKDVTIVATGAVNTSIPALQNGLIDAWMGFEPGTTIALDQMKIGASIVDLRKEGPETLTNYESNAFAATSSYISSHDAVIKHLVTAIDQAQKWIADPANKAELETIVASNMQIDKSLIPTMLDDNLATFGAVIPQKNIQNSIDLMKQANLIKGSPTYADVVATQYAPAA
jgi:ABC-type nitrate/sulfonate/bicarbonate transport system substrate-binding protein